MAQSSGVHAARLPLWPLGFVVGAVALGGGMTALVAGDFRDTARAAGNRGSDEYVLVPIKDWREAQRHLESGKPSQVPAVAATTTRPAPPPRSSIDESADALDAWAEGVTDSETRLPSGGGGRSEPRSSLIETASSPYSAPRGGARVPPAVPDEGGRRPNPPRADTEPRVGPPARRLDDPSKELDDLLSELEFEAMERIHANESRHPAGGRVAVRCATCDGDVDPMAEFGVCTECGRPLCSRCAQENRSVGRGGSRCGPCSRVP